VAEAFVIPTEAMAPTLQPGDQILVDKLWFTPKRLKRNSLVVYRSAGPNSPPHIMRVVGLPGDEIEIKSEGNRSRICISVAETGRLLVESGR